jgi:hypothetical protein
MIMELSDNFIKAVKDDTYFITKSFTKAYPLLSEKK